MMGRYTKELFAAIAKLEYGSQQFRYLRVLVVSTL